MKETIGKLLVCGLILFGLSKLPTQPVDTKTYQSNDPSIQTAAKNLSVVCANSDRIRCYESEFRKLVKQHNLAFAEATLSALQDIDIMAKSCHTIAHHIAREAVKKSPNDWQNLLDSINVNACGSGFLHGVLEAHLGDDPNIKFDGKLSQEICDRGSDEYRIRMCTHFMGHFFLLENQDEVDAALPDCNDISPRLKYECFVGVFMEHHQRLALVDHGLLEPPTYNPRYVKSLETNCHKYDGDKGNACWAEMAEIFAKTYGYDANLIYDNCNHAKDFDRAKSCYLKGVIILATYPLDLGPQLNQVCDFYKDDENFQDCLNYFLSALIHYTVKFTDRGIILCESINQQNEWCMRQLGGLLSKFVPSVNERVQLCQKARLEYQKLCAKLKS